MTLEIQVLAWDRHKTVAELKWLMRSQSYVHSMFIAHQQLQIFLLSSIQYSDEMFTGAWYRDYLCFIFNA